MDLHCYNFAEFFLSSQYGLDFHSLTAQIHVYSEVNRNDRAYSQVEMSRIYLCKSLIPCLPGCSLLTVLSTHFVQNLLFSDTSSQINIL